MDFDTTSETITPNTLTYLTIGNSGGVVAPSGTTAQRPGSPLNGTLRYNTTTALAELYQAGVWINIGTTAPASPAASVQFNNSGSFGGSANLTWDNTNNRLSIITGTLAQSRLRVGGSTDVSTATVYIETDASDNEGQRVYFNSGSVATSGWIAYAYDTNRPYIRITDADDDPTFISFNTIGAGTYAAPQYSSSFGARGTIAGIATGFSWQVSGTEIASMDTQFFKQPSGTTIQRPGTPSAGMLRYNSTTTLTEEYNGVWKPVGRVLQVVTGNIAATTGTTLVPYDNTVPTSSEGFQIWSQSFTPISTSSTIIIQYSITISHGTAAARNIISSVFSGTTNLGAVIEQVNATLAANIPGILTQTVTFFPGSISTITLSCRVGASAAGTLSINQTSAATLGGAAVTQYSIVEVL